MKQDRVLNQIDRMLASGRITKDEAASLRSPEGTEAFDQAVGVIQARHATGHLEAAVDAGDMTREEADDYVEQLQRGDHPKGLRACLSKHRPKKH